MPNIVAIIGGSKGIGLAIAREYLKFGFFPIFVSRGKPELICNNQKHIPIDIDDQYNRENAISKLTQYFLEVSIERISCHFLSGGSLGIYRNNGITSIELCQRILLHNLSFPYWSASLINQQLTGQKCEIEFHFYSSSAAFNRSTHCLYASAKLGLEEVFRDFAIKQGTNRYSFLYRLGIVLVEHKYLTKLSSSEPAKYDKIISESIPTGYALKPNEVARVVWEASLKRKACNAMIMDISGGNSWMRF